MNDKYSNLFEALALASLPIERVFLLALEVISEDQEISEKYKKELIKDAKGLLMNSLNLHCYLEMKNPSFNHRFDGKEKHEKIREKIRNHFPYEDDKDYNLHITIENEIDKKFK